MVYFFIQRYYIKSSRQLKRLESISKSPIFSHFAESVVGMSTIRAFSQSNRFVRENMEKVETNVQCNYYNFCSNRWLGVRIETLGNVIIFFAALFAILSRDTLSTGKAGLSISYAMMITGAFKNTLEFRSGNPKIFINWFFGHLPTGFLSAGYFACRQLGKSPQR